MNKSELVREMAERGALTQVSAECALNAFMAVTMDVLAKGQDVTLVGFGTFTSAVSAERPGRNPSTGEPITIPEKRRVRFSAGKAFKDRLNG